MRERIADWQANFPMWLIAHKLGDSSPMSSPCQLVKRIPVPSSRHPFHYLLVLLYEVILQTKYLHKPSHHVVRIPCSSLNNASQPASQLVSEWDGRQGGREAGTAQDTGDGRGGGGWGEWRSASGVKKDPRKI